MSDATIDPDAQAIPQAPRIEYRNVHTGWSAYEGLASSGVRDEALAGFSLILPAGQVTVLLGDHKSGKSLVALHLLGEVPLKNGQVISNGQSVWEMSEQRRLMLHHQVGVLRGGTRIRESHIDPASSVRENIIELLRRSSDCANPDEEVGVWLTDYDLTEVADSLPDKLGSGARRRLALALALAWDPALVVVDDPGEAFDYVHRGLLVKAFKKWHVRTGATVLITLHSLELAKILGHQVAVLRDGRVLAQGIPARVLDGVIDDETFEARFHTGLGGVAEADSLRLGNLRTDAVRWGGNYLDLGRPLRRAR